MSSPWTSPVSGVECEVGGAVEVLEEELGVAVFGGEVEDDGVFLVALEGSSVLRPGEALGEGLAGGPEPLLVGDGVGAVRGGLSVDVLAEFGGGVLGGPE